MEETRPDRLSTESLKPIGGQHRKPLLTKWTPLKFNGKISELVLTIKVSDETPSVQVNLCCCAPGQTEGKLMADFMHLSR